MKTLILACALVSLGTPSWAVNKCTGPDGKVSFQDAPCAGKGEKLDVRPAAGDAPTKTGVTTQPQAAVPAAPASAPTAPQAAQPPQVPPPAPAKSALVAEADACLAWYKPLLRDPAGAYYTAPSKDRRVVTITVHATNGYGGYVTQAADCEFINGRLDSDWTKIHAKRAGWQVK